jgi:uncharacterized membrane protein required for colicin V production
MNRKTKYRAAALGLLIGAVLGILIGTTMFRNVKQCEGVIQENKLLKDLIFQYENYPIESP